MAVAVQGSRQSIVQPDYEDPVNKILKGLEIAANMYKVQDAKTEAEKIKAEAKAEKDLTRKEKETSQKIDLASKGLKLQDGKVVEDPESSVFKARLLKTEPKAPKEVDPTVAALRDISLQGKIKELQDKEKELVVPGYTKGSEVQPSPAEAQKLRKATATSELLSKKLGRMRELVSNKGPFEYGGEAGQEMETLATEIQLIGKSPELYELGVLAGPDLTLLQKITADPTSLSSLFTRDKTRLKQIDTQIQSLKDKLETTSKSLGYEKKGEPKKEEFKFLENGKKLKKVPGGWEEVD